MICPVCQSDNLRVVRMKRGVKTDPRVVQCGECKTFFDTETKITHIIDDGKSVPIEKANGLLSAKWEKFKEQRYNQTRMF